MGCWLRLLMAIVRAVDSQDGGRDDMGCKCCWGIEGKMRGLD